MSETTHYAAIDIETYDPLLLKKGPGFINGTAKVLGVGIHSDDLGVSGYYSSPDERVDSRFTVKEFLADASIVKIMHNGVYDLDGLCNGWEVQVNGRLEDTMTRESLLDMYSESLSLDSSCKLRGVGGKNKEDTIDEWWALNKPSGVKGKAIANLHLVPKEVVGMYCVQDCKATYDLYFAQQPLLEAKDLTRANDIEVRLLPLLSKMRANGVRIDQEALANIKEVVREEYQSGYKELEDIGKAHGMTEFSLTRPKVLKEFFDRLGLKYQFTEKGNPCFSSKVLANMAEDIPKKIVKVRSKLKLLDGFLEGNLTELQVGDHIHCCFYPAKRDGKGGTITGRWSSANPNMQNIPAREDKHGKEMRSLFVPEEGCLLGAFDYKQMEYRVFAHYAYGPHGEVVRKAFLENPDLDYHQMVIDMMNWGSLGKDGRLIAKAFNFGSLYGLGLSAFAESFRSVLLATHPGCTDEFALAKDLREEYFRKCPFIRDTLNIVQKVGTKRGYVITFSGRRQLLQDNDPKNAYKLVNHLIQGSTADIVKKAIANAFEMGIFDILKLHLQVHDELVFSIPQTREGYDACVALRETMKASYADILKVPMGVDTEVGPDWGHCSMENWAEFEARFK